MKQRKLVWQLYPSYLVITLGALLAVAFYSSGTIRNFYEGQVADDLEAGGYLIAEQVLDLVVNRKYDELDLFCKRLGKHVKRRITIVLTDGTVIADSEGNPEEMDNHSGRPEVTAAIAGEKGLDVHVSPTLGIKMMYVAVPLLKDGDVFAVLRTAISVSAVDMTLKEIYWRMALGGLAVALAAAVVSLVLSRSISRPLEEIRHGAELFAQGKLDHKLKAGNCREITAVATAMNKMAYDMGERIKTITQLENMRKDFVANVSHELKTPITSIKGFVETLLDGAISDSKQAREFLKIIAKHSNRLNSIIEDLLSLSRLEDSAGKKSIAFEQTRIKDVLAAAAELSRMKSAEKDIKVEVFCDESIEATVNAALIEQAVVNLIDNAIKYSGTGGKVQVSGSVQNKRAEISVKDEGCGIEDKHIGHIFERFYVTDKARSRKLGGTGLGLAIVKHIAQVHGGSVSVESAVGRGSTFTICIPTY